MLRLYRDALALRRARPQLGTGPFAWLDAPSDVLAFERGPGLVVVVNLGREPVDLPPETGELLLASDPLDADGRLPADTGGWWLSR
jgi:alpha-glucosidase